MDALYAHARVDDVDIDARSQWVCKGKTPALAVLSATKQAISIKLATTVGLFLNLTLTLQTCIWLVPHVFN